MVKGRPTPNKLCLGDPRCACVCTLGLEADNRGTMKREKNIAEAGECRDEAK
jgi:hypothetical protein